MGNGLGTKVYMVTLDGFDTHANQEWNQRKLLEDFSKSIKEFYQDLKATGMDDKVLTMTISEFGRRPYENGSYGTDHGAASPVMLFGGALEENGFRSFFHENTLTIIKAYGTTSSIPIYKETLRHRNITSWKFRSISCVQYSWRRSSSD